MFYDDDPAFTLPRNIDTPIWRYMNFTQFVFLLETGCLHFSRPDAFPDSFEGTMPRLFRQELASLPALEVPNAPQMLQDVFKGMRENTCVNCWHANKHESAAMWRLYLNNDEGIAVRSTFARLTKSFDDDDNIAIHVGKVKYKDYDRENLSADNFFSLLMHKRRSFAHENEVRAIAIEVTKTEGMRYLWNHQSIDPAGKDIPVNLHILVEAIYVSPNKQSWFRRLVDQVLKRYGFDFEVRQSDLERDPIW